MISSSRDGPVRADVTLNLAVEGGQDVTVVFQVFPMGHYHKLVATNAVHRTVLKVSTYDMAGLPDVLVARCMTQRVIDKLEAIYVTDDNHQL